MQPIVLMTDRSVEEALPALLGRDAKVEALSKESLGDVLGLRPDVLLLDAGELPARAHAVLVDAREHDARIPIIVIVERSAIAEFPWAERADDVIYAGAPPAELDLRLALVRRRAGRPQPGAIRLGPLLLDPIAFQASVEGRLLDLTYKEFALLRFMAERPERVFTRPDLLREVWGYGFYGGTRTVDVHVRRLRAKLGPGMEGLIETIRGVGYRAVREPSRGAQE